MELVEDETKSKRMLKRISLSKVVVIIVDGMFGRERIIG